ncbi:MAG: hypothetical protein JXX14_21375 [Deltaproteobacteria bacterium]|nr:hypothetical protein [Deltaproteobacteria bacterium]
MKSILLWVLVWGCLCGAGCDSGGAGGSDGTVDDTETENAQGGDSDDTASEDGSSDSEGITGDYNGIPGTHPGNCTYDYAPYDLLAIVTGKEEAAAWIKYRYDGKGNIATVESTGDATTLLTLAWDGYRLVGSTLTQFIGDKAPYYTEESRFEYNSDNHPVTWHKYSYSAGSEPNDENGVHSEWTFTYQNDRVSQITEWACTSDTDCATVINTRTFEYTGSSMVRRITNTNGSTREYAYNEEDYLLSTMVSDVPDMHFEYTWNADGRLAGKQFTSGGSEYVREYTYDNGVLTQAAYALSVTAYDYTTQADACAVLRAWPIRFLDAFFEATSQELMMINYGDGAPTGVLW